MAWTMDQIAAADPDFAAQVNANLARRDPVIAGDFAAQVNARARQAENPQDPKDPKDPLIAADERWVTYQGTLPPIEVPTGLKAMGVGVFVFGIVWAALGLSGLVMSGVCFTRKGGTTSENILGLLLALCFGPFYWFYKLGSSTYCTKLKVAPLPQ